MLTGKTLAILGLDEGTVTEVVKKRFTDIRNNVTAEEIAPVLLALDAIWDLGDVSSFNLVDTYNHELIAA
jgi:hypothetical protein